MGEKTLLVTGWLSRGGGTLQNRVTHQPGLFFFNKNNNFTWWLKRTVVINKNNSFTGWLISPWLFIKITVSQGDSLVVTLIKPNNFWFFSDSPSVINFFICTVFTVRTAAPSDRPLWRPWVEIQTRDERSIQAVTLTTRPPRLPQHWVVTNNKSCNRVTHSSWLFKICKGWLLVLWLLIINKRNYFNMVTHENINKCKIC